MMVQVGKTGGKTLLCAAHRSGSAYTLPKWPRCAVENTCPSSQSVMPKSIVCVWVFYFVSSFLFCFFSLKNFKIRETHMRRLTQRTSVALMGMVGTFGRPGHQSMMKSQMATTEPHRFQSTRTTASGVNYALLPPAFDLPRWNDDPSKGYCLRVSYTEERVALTYIKQAPGTGANDHQAPTEVGGGEEEQYVVKVRRHGERLVSVYLPNVYIARFLAVLEGSIPKCDIASRQTTGTFSAGTEPNTFVLSCTSSIPRQEPLEWTTELEPAAALMLHRFLTQSLHFNNGFQK